jgi:hypothetical protein
MRCPGAAKLSLIEWNAFRRRPVIASVIQPGFVRPQPEDDIDGD